LAGNRFRLKTTTTRTTRSIHLSDENVAGQSLTVGEYAEDYAAFEAQMQSAPAKAEETISPTADADAGNGEAETESDAGTTDPAEDKTEQDEEENDAEKPRKKGGWQRAKEKAERENAELRERLAAIEGRLAGDPAKGAPAKAESDAGEVKTFSGKPEPKLDAYDSYEQYTKDLARWQFNEIRAEDAAEQRKQTEAQARTNAVKSFHDRAKDVAKRPGYEDFQEVIDSDLVISGAVHACMIESEHGPEIGYYLGTNPAEAERLNQLSPLAAAREIGKIEARFTKSAPGNKPKVSKAEDPITPLKARRSAAVTSIDDPDADYATFEKRANARFSRS
jgi:hypothetical protein